MERWWAVGSGWLDSPPDSVTYEMVEARLLGASHARSLSSSSQLPGNRGHQGLSGAEFEKS